MVTGVPAAVPRPTHTGPAEEKEYQKHTEHRDEVVI